MGRLGEIAPGVLVATSELYSTTTTVVARGTGAGSLLIDPAVTVPELAAIAAQLAAARLLPHAGFATHPHWDHVLWCSCLGDVPRYAAQRAAAVAAAERDGLVSGMQAAAPGHDLALFGRLTALAPDAEAIPWDGPQARVITHDGHAPGHSAVFLPGTGTLIAGDMLSDIEIPLLDLAGHDPLGDYRAGLDSLAALPGVRHIVPGHGSVGDAAEFRRRVAADVTYLDSLARGEDTGDPRLALEWLRREHEQHVAHVRAGRPAC
jgi:glyoxylase-like metal-dependent hydrolase (beta-lactamase superfamily II)